MSKLQTTTIQTATTATTGAVADYYYYYEQDLRSHSTITPSYKAVRTRTRGGLKMGQEESTKMDDNENIGEEIAALKERVDTLESKLNSVVATLVEGAIAAQQQQQGIIKKET